MVVRSNPSSTCRVVSAEAKTNAGYDTSRLSGVLEVMGERRWAAVREGQLVVHRSEDPGSRPHSRLPLRGLHLQPAFPPGLAFSLTRHGDSQPTATFKVKNDAEYERWVKTLAAELMRQTPLDCVRFLDILGITGSLRRSRSADSVAHPPPQHQPPPDIQISHPRQTRLTSLQEAPCLRYKKRTDLPDVVRDLPPCSRKSRSRRREWLGLKPRGQSAETICRGDEVDSSPTNAGVSELISRCQRSDVYVPVKEKRLLFESLCRRGDGSHPQVTRAQSVADLQSAASQCVKDMARIFEQRSTTLANQNRHYFDVNVGLSCLRAMEMKIVPPEQSQSLSPTLVV